MSVYFFPFRATSSPTFRGVAPREELHSRPQRGTVEETNGFDITWLDCFRGTWTPWKAQIHGSFCLRNSNLKRKYRILPQDVCQKSTIYSYQFLFSIHCFLDMDQPSTLSCLSKRSFAGKRYRILGSQLCADAWVRWMDGFTSSFYITPPWFFKTSASLGIPGIWFIEWICGFPSVKNESIGRRWIFDERDSSFRWLRNDGYFFTSSLFSLFVSSSGKLCEVFRNLWEIRFFFKTRHESKQTTGTETSRWKSCFRCLDSPQVLDQECSFCLGSWHFTRLGPGVVFFFFSPWFPGNVFLKSNTCRAIPGVECKNWQHQFGLLYDTICFGIQVWSTTWKSIS